jgi:CRP-like cAMP-binding protein
MSNQDFVSCKQCSCLLISVFKHLNDSEHLLLQNSISTNIYKKGDVLYREGSKILGCYCIMSGILKIYKMGSDGKSQIIAFAQRGDITGYRSVISNELACTTAEIIEEATICFIPSDIIFSLVKSNYNFALALMQLTCKELNQANIYIKDIAQKTVRERLSEILLMLYNTFGVDQDGYLAITLTRQDLANIVGTATESVIRLLSDFKSDGIISLSGKKIKLLDIKLLTRISESY